MTTVFEMVASFYDVDYLVKDVKNFMLSGDGEREKLQNRLEEVHDAVSSNISIAKCENDNSEVLNKPAGLDMCLVIEGGKIDVSLDENLMPPEKHSVSMEVRSFIYI